MIENMWVANYKCVFASGSNILMVTPHKIICLRIIYIPIHAETVTRARKKQKYLSLIYLDTK